ncbi:transposase [Blautia sp. JLR.GB0024]|uniref:transposase n=1 Tax=Blautia sp. JLR.GB0024 TaxID=3123295 RepID=UPI003007D1DE
MRKAYSPEFKSKLVLEVLRGERMLNEIASDHEVHPNMLTRWETEATITSTCFLKMKMLKCANS